MECDKYVPKISRNVPIWYILAAHTQIDKKTIGAVIMMTNVQIWYNLKRCTDL